MKKILFILGVFLMFAVVVSCGDDEDSVGTDSQQTSETNNNEQKNNSQNEDPNNGNPYNETEPENFWVRFINDGKAIDSISAGKGTKVTIPEMKGTRLMSDLES